MLAIVLLNLVLALLVIVAVEGLLLWAVLTDQAPMV